MQFMLRLMCVLVAASILMVTAAAPAMACPTGGSGMAMPGGNHEAPMAPASCDLACLACLVQPEPLRIAVPASWLKLVSDWAVSQPLAGYNVPPDLPPPRIWMA